MERVSRVSVVRRRMHTLNEEEDAYLGLLDGAGVTSECGGGPSPRYDEEKIKNKRITNKCHERGGWRTVPYT